ncbi:MAG: phospho-N-acetylmuramoyl-pentapeptide-transferase [Deltaproteobacteria bacterium]
MQIQIAVLISAFILTLVSGAMLIPLLERLKFGQFVRDDGPQSHLSKAGTPTMGGIIFLLPIAIISGLFSVKYQEILPVLITTLLFGLVGFLDDYIKIGLKRSKGLSARQKILGLLIVSTAFGYYLYRFTDLGTAISVPFTDYWLDFTRIPVPFTLNVINLEWAFIPFIVIVMLAATNSVNLTDGLDGLAAGVSLIIMVFFAVAAIISENIGLTIVFCSIAGACLGFLAYNMKPAKVFMGDTGSLALGGAIASAGIVLKMPLVLLIVAGVCVIEAISVIIQVAVFKKTKKRVFKMAPIHHHFELSGWSENRVVWTFWIATVILCIIGFVSLRYTIL